MNTLQTDVVVVGAGPCGVTLANYLGAYGVRAVLVERAADILDYPRAVGVDDEALRSWQGVGLADTLLRDMLQNVPARYHNSRGRCFAEVAPEGQPFGWPRRNLFLQPLTEATLRKGLDRYDCVRVELGLEITGLASGERMVSLQGRRSDGEPIDIAARYVVGADGGRSTIRKLIGVELTGTTDTHKWLVIDVTDDTMDAPFTGIYCDPQRPSFSIHLPYGYRRLEFLLKPDETEEEVLKPERLEALMRLHYGATGPLPPVKRSRIYLHHSRIAERFSVGRVFLAGDAAHLQPPFFGQGMNSGLRDATNLAWKLAWVLKGHADEAILQTYDTERRHHALAMVKLATWMGSFYRPWNRLTESARDLFFDVIRKLPGAKDYVLQLKFKPMSRYTQGVVLFDERAARRKDYPVGRMFMQPSVLVGDKVSRLDDVIGPGFCILGIHTDPAELLGRDTLEDLATIGCRTLWIRPSRSVGPGRQARSPSLEVEDVHGKFRDWKMRHPEWPFIVLRPDRYVAAVGSAAQLPETVRSLVTLLRAEAQAMRLAA
ncbi:bifunctional 3-(3-hydroxy-phenyl)propionate/3-hydroxycinnamic acid hydroxylase [Ramlibacter sp. AW1]|uniref:Bifunctional 3-(3-hydroxy-phenyl)propionate/3-hydroxycinnamic acid hydroxylase n=1 Tax=Ramlibacter aurantiacus TaxID=2801330 RepID=A0A937D803_9BURK|nr:bifunctional 3-(3-hydroxy-phenyl)propionate/3-hydroxycinnamic acid hydroxylase [Ramlibacter aurantiacus]MBL0421521.1 bifunctional 3-(3-hydroxy-phenyl)propionate/3-hydroxycinnamic acid hydroxylase [Ramlibacter aurantiacus]